MIVHFVLPETALAVEDPAAMQGCEASQVRKGVMIVNTPERWCCTRLGIMVNAGKGWKVQFTKTGDRKDELSMSCESRTFSSDFTIHRPYFLKEGIHALGRKQT